MSERKRTLVAFATVFDAFTGFAVTLEAGSSESESSESESESLSAFFDGLAGSFPFVFFYSKAL